MCTLIFLITRRIGASRSAAVIAALAFAVSPVLEPWAFEFRPDMSALMVELLGLYLFQCGLGAAAAGVFALAFLVKQSSVAGITAVALYLWLRGEGKRAIEYAIGWLAVALAGIAFFAARYPHFWLNTFEGIASDLVPGAALGLLGSVLLYHFAIFALAAYGVASGGRKLSLATCFLLAAIAEDSAASLRWGSNIYYFLPTLAAAIIVAAPQLNILLDRIGKLGTLTQAAWGLTIAALLAIQLALGLQLGVGKYGMGLISGEGESACERAPSYYKPATLFRLRALNGPILADDASLAMLEPTRVHFIEFMALHGMLEKGIYNDGPLIEEIDRRRLAAIALTPSGLNRQWQGHSFIWPALRAAIAANYVPDRGYAAPPFLMVPRQDTWAEGVSAAAGKRCGPK